VKARSVLLEAWRTALSSRAFALLFAGLTAAVVLAITMLTAQVEAQRESVRAAFEQERFRTVSLVDSQDKGVLPAAMRSRVGSLSTVTRAWSASGSFEVWNGALDDGSRVSAQMVDAQWDRLPITLTTGRLPAAPGEALAEDGPATALGVDDTGGWVEDADGRAWSIVGTFRPDHDRAPRSVLVPWQSPTPVRQVTVVAASMTDVEPTTRAAAALTDVSGPGDLTVERSDDAAALGGDVTSTVERHAVVIVATVMGAGVLVLGLLSLLMVHGRRQEFGRRRALGAGRGAVIGLVVAQGVLVISVGAVAGALLGSVAGVALWGQVVDPELQGSVVVATVMLAVTAQVPSAVLAGLRDPVRVLRTA
jgi:putative ABC transport system permease protein